MESVSEESLLKETEIVASPPANFGELLRRRREEAGLSVADLARKTGVVRTTIHNIEQGLTSASPQTLKLLASVKALRAGVPSDHLAVVARLKPTSATAAR